MKEFFNKLGFHKMDEMESNIALKAQRNALIYVEFALMAWSLYETYKVYTYHTKLNSFPCFLLITTSMVMIISQLYLQRRAVKDDDEYKTENSLFKFFLCFAIGIGIIIAIGTLLIILGF